MPPTTSSLFYIKMLTTATAVASLADAITTFLPSFLRAILRQVRAGVPKEGKSGILFIPFNPSLLVFIDPLLTVMARSYKLGDIFPRPTQQMSNMWPPHHAAMATHCTGWSVVSLSIRDRVRKGNNQTSVTPSPQQLWVAREERKTKDSSH